MYEVYEIETAILNLLLRGHKVDYIFSQVDEDDFADPLYQKIFIALRDFYEKNGKIDFLLFSEFLRENKAYEGVNSVILAQIYADDLPLPDMAEDYIAKLKEKRAKRELLKLIENIVKTEDSLNEVIYMGIKGMREIMAQLENNSVVPAIEQIEEIMQEIDKAQEVIQTGIPALDAFLDGGFRQGVYAFAGMPFVGKTTFLNYICDCLALRGVPSLYIHTEEPRARLVERTMKRIKDRKLLERILLFRFIVHLKYDTDYIKYIYDAHRLTQGRLVVVIDSLHNLQGRGETEDRRLSIAQNVRRLYDLVEELKIPIIFTSFIPRSSYMSKPSVAVFKETGDIEYLIDVGLALVYADDDYEDILSGNEVYLYLYLLKDRLGRNWDTRKVRIPVVLKRDTLEYVFDKPLV